MVLVGYSDSEGSDSESQPTRAPKANQKPPAAQTNFAVDKGNPKKIRVNLTETLPTTKDAGDGEPPAKRPRTGAGTFSGFNAMLPAPKRDDMTSKSATSNKAPARKVFSLKTGAEPAFSRDSDAELRDLFAGEDTPKDTDLEAIPTSIPKPTFSSEDTKPTVTAGKPFMFKPLSVARNAKKKKPVSQLTGTNGNPASQTRAELPSQSLPAPSSRPDTATIEQPKPPKKISLFSSGPSELPTQPETKDVLVEDEDGDEIVELLDDDDPTSTFFSDPTSHNSISTNQPESLANIADNLNLTAAERRQLLGRQGGNASKIINFNTDIEYAANQAHIAAGEQIQHNPVRAIAPGKHSLKQLVSSAQGQKEALEESFASGRRNKREAGSKYGW